MTSQFHVTEAAYKQISKLCVAKNGKGLYINIKKSGCSGYAYDLSIIQKPTKEDVIFPQANALFVAVSKENLSFIVGSTLDYVKEGVNARFKFINPNETGSCGCGESFTITQQNQDAVIKEKHAVVTEE